MRFFRRKIKGASFFFGMGAAQHMNHKYNTLAEEGYALNAVVHACVNKIATAISSVDVGVYEKNRAGKVTKLDSHPLEMLFSHPNKAQSGKQFMTALASFRLIGGNAYVYGNGMEARREPLELQLLDPGAMTVKPGVLFPKQYEYLANGQDATIFPVDQVTGASQILHIKTFNPLNPWLGLSPMVAAAFGVDIVNGGQKWNKKLIDNECRPPGALVVKDSEGKSSSLTDEQYNRLKEDIERQYSGANNAGRPLLLEGGLEWQQLGMNPRDMDFKENIWAAARFIASAYQVPPQLVNIPGESTYANYEQAEVSFWANTVLPTLASILDDFNRWFASIYGDSVYLWYDEEMIPALEPLRQAKFNRLNAATFLTLDEKREAAGFESYQPSGLPGGALYVNSGSIPVELAGDLGLSEVTNAAG